jgi:secondary thiamine-phosphate synthase enzyme
MYYVLVFIKSFDFLFKLYTFLLVGSMKIFNIKTSKRKEAIDITDNIRNMTTDIEKGVVIIYTPHTTSAITINEAYDSDVAYDITEKLCKLVPYSKEYRHLEGNSDAHIQASIIGASETVIIENNKLQLGRWQGIFFMEFDGPRNRQIYIKILKG